MLVVAGPQVLTAHCGKSIMCIGTTSNFFLPKMSIVYFFYTFVSNSFTVAKFRPAPARNGMKKENWQISHLPALILIKNYLLSC